MLNQHSRPTAAVTNDVQARGTFTGNRALDMEEALLFEVGRNDVTGVDLPALPHAKSRLGRHARKAAIDLPGLSEPEAMRHYVRLSRQNYAIDAGIHPLQPLSTVPCAVALMAELSRWLLEMTGMAAVALTPKAGAHGELTGMIAIKAALAARGEHRATVLVPQSAHGTNPATAALLGYRVVDVPAQNDGTVHPEEVKARLDRDVAAIMLTNPNTCGLFERSITAIAEAVHAAGAYVYADGANFNAIVGKVKPGSLGVDAMHINLHKTFRPRMAVAVPAPDRWSCRPRSLRLRP